jgi:hypothetical protein
MSPIRETKVANVKELLEVQKNSSNEEIHIICHYIDPATIYYIDLWEEIVEQFATESSLAVKSSRVKPAKKNFCSLSNTSLLV